MAYTADKTPMGPPALAYYHEISPDIEIAGGEKVVKYPLRSPPEVTP